MSCGKISDIEIGNIESVKLNKGNSSTLNIEARIPVNNPSSHRIKVQAIELKTFINDRYLGKLTCHDKIIIKPKSNKIYTLNFDVKISNIFTATLLLMNPHQHIKLGLQGTVKAQTCLVTKKIKIDEVRKVSF